MNICFPRCHVLMLYLYMEVGLVRVTAAMICIVCGPVTEDLRVHDYAGKRLGVS